MFTALKNFDWSRLFFWRKKPAARKWKRSEPKARTAAAGLRMQTNEGRISVAPTGNGERPLTARNARRLAKKQERKHGRR
mgnify:CR=1 FL=1